MTIFGKPILEWREPDEVTSFRWMADFRRRRLVRTAAVFVALGLWTGYVSGLVGDADKLIWARCAISNFVLALGCVVIWISRCRPRRFRIFPRDQWRLRIGEPKPFAAAVGLHPLCPKYRALGLAVGKGRTVVTGIPDEVSDEMIRNAWAESECADVPLSFTTDALDWTESPPPRESMFFRWPNGPERWPLAPANRQRYSRLAVLWAIPLFPFFLAAMPFSLVVPLALAVVVVAMDIVGHFIGWNDNTVIAMPYGLTLSSGKAHTVHVRWRDLDEVVVRISPYEGESDFIVAQYHDSGYHVKDTFWMRLLSRRFAYERFVSALSENTGCAAEVKETKEGLTIALKKFVPKASTGVGEDSDVKKASA